MDVIRDADPLTGLVAGEYPSAADQVDLVVPTRNKFGALPSIFILTTNR